MGIKWLNNSLAKGNAMLIIKRKAGESVTLNNDITVTVLTTGNEVKLSIEAPKDVKILRTELLAREPEDVRRI